MAAELSVLLVEDDEDDALLARAFLASVEGVRYRVTWVTTLADAMLAMDGERFDVHLVDLRLGADDGLAVARRILGRERYAPVIILTGVDDRDVDVQAAEAGVADFLVKSAIDGAVLERSIRYATGQQRALRALAESEERYALALAGANDGLWDWDLRTGHLHLSARWAQMLGYDPASLAPVPASWLELVHPDDRPALERGLRQHLDGATEHFEAEHRVRAADGTWRWMLARGLAVRGSDGLPSRFAGSQTDVSDRKDAEARLQFDALHDGLTGLPNRVLFLERLEHALSRRRRAGGEVAVLFLDLDRFKVVNDSLGHQAGDRLLVAVARRLEAALRPGDTVARLGGDEFTLLLEDVAGQEEAQAVASRVLQVLGEPLEVDGSEQWVSASVGIALSRDDDDAGSLVRDADAAMYRAKTEGRGRHAMFDARLHRQAVERLGLETRLRRGLADGGAQVAVAFQPVVDARTLRVEGFEALARWRDEDGGLVLPDRFIPVAEDTGLIHPLGRHVLETAVGRAAAWREQLGRPLRMAINISRPQLLEPRFLEELEAAVSEHGLPPGDLRLEVTETLASADPDAVRRALEGLHASLGIASWLDDFGTGASSLTFLQRFPGDAVKIDRSFVQAMEHDDSAFRIVKAIIGLAHDLDMQVVGEGVETQGQLDALRVLGCDLVQGFLVSAPVPAERAAELLEVHAA